VAKRPPATSSGPAEPVQSPPFFAAPFRGAAFSCLRGSRGELPAPRENQAHRPRAACDKQDVAPQQSVSTIVL
jgi:hypothetical protein